MLPDDFPEGYRLPTFKGVWQDLGSGHYAALYANRHAVLEVHRTPEGKWCGGFLHTDAGACGQPDRPHWDVSSWEPLTLSPSVHCSREMGGCGAHGRITAGRWE